MLIPPPLMIAIRLAPLLYRLMKLADKYNENEPDELLLNEEQQIINNLEGVLKQAKEREFAEIFDDEHDYMGN